MMEECATSACQGGFQIPRKRHKDDVVLGKWCRYYAINSWQKLFTLQAPLGTHYTVTPFSLINFINPCHHGVCCWMDKEGDGGDPAVIGSTSLKSSAMHLCKLLLRQFMAASQAQPVHNTRFVTILGHPLSRLPS
ncbi:unnamed protein product [Sphenostylis stenocarpa]|uniref:Uncharacterized protein n=1 Tax=Sphenostylis stenocarpa TaxID=92480 RepID=A0AA86W5R5_9FABA|nr:unnamed protein product [Sphenostylis stenocarpa]